jgi:hypothetical protein
MPIVLIADEPAEETNHAEDHAAETSIADHTEWEPPDPDLQCD